MTKVKNILFIKTVIIFLFAVLTISSFIACTVISNDSEDKKSDKKPSSQNNSAESSSVSSNNSNASSIAETVIFYDNFTNATDSNLLTAGYTDFTTNAASPASPMYIKVGGTTVSVSGGDLTITAARISIGALSAAATTSSSTPGGCFNLSSAYTIYIGIKSISGSGNFQVMIDNNTTSGSASPHGTASRIYNTAASGMSAGELVINSSIGTASSFVFLRTESSTTIVIDYIRIVAGTGTGTSSSSSTGSSTGSSSNSSVSSSSVSSSSSSSVSYSVPSSTGSPVGYANANGGTTGGAGGSAVFVSTGDELQAAIDNRAAITTPIIIYVTGPITLNNSTNTTEKDKIIIKGSSDTKQLENISIIGIGTNGEFNGIGLQIWRAHNIIIQNIKFHHVLYNTGEGDGMLICGPASNIWVDHCEFYNTTGDLDGDGTVGDIDDKDFYDGLLDIKYAGAQDITISHNIFHDSYKTNLLGYTTSDARDWNITFYANYYYNCNSRLPLIRGGAVHMLNNYYLNNADSGSNNRCGGVNLYEGNYYKNSTDVIGWFYGDVTGYWDLGPGVTDSNYYDNITWSPISGVIYSTVNSLGFLDTGTFTPSYTYTPLTAADVPSYVLSNAGTGKL